MNATFNWIVYPKDGTFRGMVYSDGSRLDGPSALLARNGWAFVVVDEWGNVIALANGLPPDWIDDIPGTEAWAMLQAACFAEPGKCQYFVDCEPCVNAVHRGPIDACKDNRPLARVHRMLHEALGPILAADVVWIPSHTGPGQCGTAIRGDGFLITEADVGHNDVADNYAKWAVEAHRVPLRIRNIIAAHDQLTHDNAVWIAKATVLANQQLQEPHRDTEASRAKALETPSADQHHQHHTPTATDSTLPSRPQQWALPPSHRRWLVVHHVYPQVHAAIEHRLA